MSRAYVLDRDTFAVLGLIDQSYTTITYARRYQAMDTITLAINRLRLYADQLQVGRLVYLPDEGDRVFLIEQVETVQSGERSKDEMTVSGRSLEGIALAERLVLPPDGMSHDAVSDTPAETAMKHYVEANAVDAADPDRNIPNLVIAADTAAGPNLNVAGRYQYLLDLLVDMGLLSGFGWEITLDKDNGQFVFEVLQGTDKSASVFFDFAFETLEKWDELTSLLGHKSVAVVAGQGEGVDRDIVVRPTVGSGEQMPSGFERREVFVDARDVELGNNDLLEARGDAELAAKTDAPALEATVHQFGSFRYREHWDLGDIVLVRNEERGLSYSARIVEVHVTIAESGAAPEIVAVLGRPFPTLRSQSESGGGAGTADSGGGAGASDPLAVHVGDAAGGVLSGTYPDPGFAVDMATQAELDAVEAGAVMDGDAAGGDLAGTYPNPTVQDDSHDHSSSTVSLAHSDLTSVGATDHHAAPVAGPDANIDVDAAGDAGTAGAFARSGHGHRLDTYSSTPARRATTGSAGTSGTAPSRGNHVHPWTIPVRRVYTASTTWSKPSNLAYIEVEVVGGGGAGGSASSTSSTQSSAGGGGGGGGYAKKLLAASDLPSSCTVTVGAGGNAGAAGNNDGGDGTASSFAGTGITTVQGNGGTGGNGSAANTGPERNVGGDGGGASGGDFNVAGEDGAMGIVGRGDGGEGDPYGGRGGSSGGGMGGGGRVSSVSGNGTAGGPYGAGGGGGYNANSQGSGRTGGAGADGVVIVTEYYF